MSGTHRNEFRSEFPRRFHFSTGFPQRSTFFRSRPLLDKEHESNAPEARHFEVLGRARAVPEAVTIADEQMVACTPCLLRSCFRFAISHATSNSNYRSRFVFCLLVLVRSTEIGASYSCILQGLEGFAQKSTTFLSFNRISEDEGGVRLSANAILCNSCLANDQQLTTNDRARSTVFRPLST
jgi:hypothetical protein